MGFVKCLVPICSQLADYTHSTTADFIMEKSEIPGNISWSRESVVVGVKQGRRHGFLSGGRIVGRWLTYPQNTLKIGKGIGFGPLHSRIWGRRRLLNFSLEGTRPLRPPAFDAHAVRVLRVEKTAKKARESQKGLFWDSLAYLREWGKEHG